MFIHGGEARVWVDGFWATAQLNEVSVETEIDTAETTTFDLPAKQYIPGLEDATVSLSGFFDVNPLVPAATFEALLSSRKRQVIPMMYLPAGKLPIQGDIAYFLNGTLSSFNFESTVDEAISLEMEFQSTVGLLRGMLLQSPITQSGVVTDEEGVDWDGGDDSAKGFHAILNVAKATGTTPTLNVVIEHSPDGSTWAPLATFPQQTAMNAVYMSGTGTVEQYLRAVWTTTGTTPSFDFSVGFKRN